MTATDGRGAWRKFICVACGHIYDEALGDADSGLAAGTRFEDIADDWVCPLCGVTKADFEPLTDDTVLTAAADTHRAGVVIIGAGLAGWSVVDALRALDKDIPITLISADDADRYHKPMLSVAISQNKTASDLVRATGADAAAAANIRLLSQTTVVAIDDDARTLTTTAGTVAYDDLVLAIGAQPAYPPSLVAARGFSHHVNHLTNFSQLQQALDTPKRIAIIGAGMIGTEIAEDLHLAGHSVTLIDMQSQPLSAMLPDIATARIGAAITELGVAYMGNQLVQSIDKTEAGLSIALQDITTKATQALTFDEVIVSTGLIVDDTLPVSVGISFDKRTGIAVNEATLQTSAPHIYALGDCISIDGIPCRYVAPHRPQAAAIASHILTGTANYEHKLPMIRLKNKCISVTANGLPRADGDWRIISDNDSELSLELYDGDKLIAKALLKSPVKVV